MANNPEYKLQCHVADYLDVTLNPTMTHWTSIENSNHTGGVAGAIKQMKDKRKGVKAGTPDIIIMYEGKVLWIELKAGKNPLTDKQVEFHRLLKQAGLDVEIVRSIAELEATIRKYRIPQKNMSHQ